MKILIRGANWIGDSVMSIPVLKAVRKTFPDAFIGIVLKPGPAELLKAVPYFDRIYETVKDSAEIKKEKFDLGILLTNSFSSAFDFWRWGVKERVGYATELRGSLLTKRVKYTPVARKKHLLEEYLDILKTAGIPAKTSLPEFFLPEENEKKAETILKMSGLKDSAFIAGICPGATYGPAKVWAKERFLAVINRLQAENKAGIVVFGGQKEQDIVDFLLKNAIYGGKIMRSPEQDILTGAALIKKCGLFVSNDTGPMHLAAALGVPTVGIFGSTSPVWTGPTGKKAAVIHKKLACSPCYERVCKKNNNKYECLSIITEKDVINKIKELKIL